MENNKMKINQLIAEFMGYKKEVRVGGVRYLIKNSWYLPNERMLFLTSWDWLMPVVEKTNKIYQKLGEVNKTELACLQAKIMVGIVRVDIESTYMGVFQFIEWYNSNPS